MNDDVVRQFDLALAAEGFLQNAALNSKLMFVAGVLVVASAATLKVGAMGRDAVARWGENFVELSAGEAGLLLGESRGDGFTFEGEGNEDSFAFTLGAANRSVRTTFCREASEAVAAVDEFFDEEVQVVIVRGRSSPQRLTPRQRGHCPQTTGSSLRAE